MGRIFIIGFHHFFRLLRAATTCSSMLAPRLVLKACRSVANTPSMFKVDSKRDGRANSVSRTACNRTKSTSSSVGSILLGDESLSGRHKFRAALIFGHANSVSRILSCQHTLPVKERDLPPLSALLLRLVLVGCAISLGCFLGAVDICRATSRARCSASPAGNSSAWVFSL